MPHEIPPHDAPPASDRGVPEQSYREVRYRHSREFAGLLDGLGASLLISTYQAGKLGVVGATSAGLNISFHNFEQAMGIAVRSDRLAIGSRGIIWFLQNAAELAPRIAPKGTYDACYLARDSFVTGQIHGHEMAWVGDELWIVNTLFSCLCTLHSEFSFVPRWQPPFITELSGNDRCHLNGVALDGGQPKYVTVMAESNEPAGWRPTKATSGAVLDVATGQRVSGGLSMPHSPRVHAERLWLLNSGLGSLETVDLATGKRDVVDRMPGYTRGLAFCGPYAFVGLSRIRETAVFGGVPIADHRDQLKCGVAVVDLRSGQSVAYLEFETGVEEIFDVQILAGTKCASLTGPYPAQDDAEDVWVVPPPGQLPESSVGPGIGAIPNPTGSRSPLNSDDDVAALIRSGVESQQQGRIAEAVTSFERVVAARPNWAEAHNHLGNAYQEKGRQDLAVACYKQAIVAQDGFAPAYQNLGYLLINFGRLKEGLAHIERAQQLRPDNINRVILATSLPVIYESSEHVARCRQQLEDTVQRLVDEDFSIDVTRCTVPTNFFAAYHGHDVRELQENLGQIYRAPDLSQRTSRRRRTDRIRVGFLSAHFCDHTIGRLNLGRVALLDRDSFEVTIIASGHHQDEMSQAFHQQADHYVELTGAVEDARRQVADLSLDVLVFADVGMNAMISTLAQSRLAPVQCVTWGHPVTTGSSSMDYFVSSQLLETDDADQHYTEQLVRLANLGTYYYRPKLTGSRRTRESFGLAPERHVYLCAQTLFKLHPEFDPVLADILRSDPLGDLVLLEGRQPQWTQLVKERFARTMPDVASRVQFLPTQLNQDFLQLNSLADVLLDTIHFGGGNTSYEGLALGTPIVTLPGPYLRSRITLALFRKIGIVDCVADSPQQYVQLAVRLGTDADYRQTVHDRICGASESLFEDPAEVREFERFLSWAADGGPGVWNCHRGSAE